MPTYRYKCRACGKYFDIWQSIKEGKKRKCPACGELALVRLISGGTGVIFKGEGWPDLERRREDYKNKLAQEEREGRNDAGSL